MATHLHKALAAGVALCSTACQEGTPVRDLTEEEKVVLEESFDQIEAVLPFVEHLAKSANEEFAFGAKKTGAAHFVADVQTTYDFLLQKMEEGNIVVFNRENLHLDDPRPGATTEESDVYVGAYYHDNPIGVDYLALPEGEPWSIGVLMHEAGHALDLHGKVVDAFIEGGSYTRPDSIEAIDIFAEEHDFSYIVSAYFDRAGYEMGYLESDIRQIDVALDALRREDDDDAYEARTQQWVSERDLARDKDGWIDARAAHEFQPSSAEYWHHIGITEKEYREALNKSGIYEYGREKFDEKYAELKAEIQRERIREKMHEHPPEFRRR